MSFLDYDVYGRGLSMGGLMLGGAKLAKGELEAKTNVILEGLSAAELAELKQQAADILKASGKRATPKQVEKKVVVLVKQKIKDDLKAENKRARKEKYAAKRLAEGKVARVKKAPKTKEEMAAYRKALMERHNPDHLVDRLFKPKSIHSKAKKYVDAETLKEVIDLVSSRGYGF